MANEKLKWTEEMKICRSEIANSPLNKETLDDEVKKVLEYNRYTFFINIPICVAGGSKYSSWQAIRKGDDLIQEALPKGYKLVAWYGWGGSGWIAQTVKEAEIANEK